MSVNIAVNIQSCKKYADIILVKIVEKGLKNEY
jgi:hypothetical protein